MQPLPRRFARLSAANILANLMPPLAGLVDTAMLGHLPDLRFLAGVALASIVFDYVFWSLGFLRMATTGLVAQAVGRDEEPAAVRVILRGAALALGIGFTLLALRDPIGEAGLRLLGGEAGVLAAGRDYYDARILGAPAALLNLVLLGWFLGRERGRAVIAISVAANVANVVLDWIFIYELGLEAAGAGYATALSQGLTTLIALSLLRRELPASRLRGELAGLRDRAAWGQMLRLQGDIMVRTFALVTAFALFTAISSRLGTVVLASNAVLQKLVTVNAYIVDGYAHALEGIAGSLGGAGRRANLARLLRMALVSGLVTAGLFAAVFVAADEAIVGLLAAHPPVIALASELSPWLVPVLTLGSVAYILDGYFIGLTAGRVLSVAMVLSFVVGFLPWAWWAMDTRDNTILWAAFTAFTAARVITLGAAVPATWRR